MRKERVVIIGSGPAGLTAALYTARAQLKPVVIAGDTPGGQVAITHEVENYPGFPGGLSGPELVERMTEHAKEFGADVVHSTVSHLDLTGGSPFRILTRDGEAFSTDSVIITSGADPRKLMIPGEAENIGAGVSYCATCDGFFFRGRDVVVVGGGDSALEEAIFLTRFVNSIHVIHRRDKLRAGPQLRARAAENEKISFIWDTVVEEIINENGSGVSAVRLRNVKSGETSDFPTEGVFVFIGHDPNNSIFSDQIILDDEGYIITDTHYRTNIEGVYAAGEIQDKLWRQVATSVGQGTSAAMATIHWLEENEASLQNLGARASAN